MPNRRRAAFWLFFIVTGIIEVAGWIAAFTAPAVFAHYILFDSGWSWNLQALGVGGCCAFFTLALALYLNPTQHERGSNELDRPARHRPLLRHRPPRWRRRPRVHDLQDRQRWGVLLMDDADFGLLITLFSLFTLVWIVIEFGARCG